MNRITGDRKGKLKGKSSKVKGKNIGQFHPSFITIPLRNVSSMKTPRQRSYLD
jgi:hypothetical protein